MKLEGVTSAGDWLATWLRAKHKPAITRDMARFGLDSDSSDEDDTVADQTLSDASGDDDAQDDDAIPRESYADSYASSHRSQSGSDSFDSPEREERGPSQSYSARSQSHANSLTRRRSSSASGSDDEGDLPQRRYAPRSISVASSRPTVREASAGPQVWAPQPVKLEPKRTAVMQASFFQQPQKDVQPVRELLPKARDNPWAPTSISLGRPEQSTAVSTLVPPAHTHLTSRVQARPNFATPVLDPNPFRSFRKYSRVDLPKSVTAGMEGSLVDAGLMLGRSFRIGWGPQGQIVHIGSLYGSAPPSSSDALALSAFRALAQSNVRLTCRRSPSMRQG